MTVINLFYSESPETTHQLKEIHDVFLDKLSQWRSNRDLITLLQPSFRNDASWMLSVFQTSLRYAALTLPGIRHIAQLDTDSKKLLPIQFDDEPHMSVGTVGELKAWLKNHSDGHVYMLETGQTFALSGKNSVLNGKYIQIGDVRIPVSDDLKLTSTKLSGHLATERQSLISDTELMAINMGLKPTDSSLIHVYVASSKLTMAFAEDLEAALLAIKDTESAVPSQAIFTEIMQQIFLSYRNVIAKTFDHTVPVVYAPVVFQMPDILDMLSKNTLVIERWITTFKRVKSATLLHILITDSYVEKSQGQRDPNRFVRGSISDDPSLNNRVMVNLPMKMETDGKTETELHYFDVMASDAESFKQHNK